MSLPKTAYFSPADPGEKLVLTFDFTNGLNGVTLVSPTVKATVDAGTDPNPNAILGSPAIVGATVLVPVSGMVLGVDYHITVTCTTTNNNLTLAVAGILPVRNA